MTWPGSLPVRRLLVAGALIVVAGLLQPAQPALAADVSRATEVDRVAVDPRISEASGLAVSGRHRGIVWTHNDSGHPARLFAVRADGRTAATVRLEGVRGADWEALATYRDAAGRAMLAVADIGDNAASRESVEIVVLREPALRDAVLRPERVIRLRYPTGPVDAETLLVDPDGRRAFVVTKGFGARIYEVPPGAWTGSQPQGVATLQPRASAPVIFATDGVMGPGGHPVLRTYGELVVLPPITADRTGGSLEPLGSLRLPRQRQGEGLALRDARTALVSSEGAGEPILRVPLPAALVSALQDVGAAATGPASAVSAGGSAKAAADGRDRTDRTDRSDPAWPAEPRLLLVAGLGLLAAAATVVVRLLRARS